MTSRLLARLARTLDLRPGEAVPTLLLLAHSLCIGIAFAFFFSFANASFLSQFGIQFLAYAYVAAGAVGYFAVALFSTLERRLSRSALLAGNLAFLLLSVAGLRFGFLASDSRWLSLLAFVWVEPLATLLDLGFWGLAGRLLDLQQAKRLSGLVSSGQSLSQIGSFFLVPLLLSLFAPSSSGELLVIAAAGLGLCLGVLLVALRRFPARLAAGAPAAGEERRDRGLAGDRYFLLISSLVAAVVLVVYFVDFSFLSVTLEHAQGRGEVQTAALARYLAVFWGTAEAIEWAIKSFLSGRLLGQFGLGFGLLSYPLAVLLFVALANGAAANAGAFLVFVSAAKLVEFVARRALFDPSSKVLFQPLPEERRFAFQTRVEGGVRQGALGLAGLALVVLGRFENADTAAIRLLVPLLLGTSGLAFLVYRRYRGKLHQALADRPPAVLAVPPVEVVLAATRRLRPPELGYALNLIESVAPALFERLLGELLESADGEVRCEAVRRLAGIEQVAAVDALARRAAEDPLPEVREAAAAAARDLAALAGRAPEAARMAFSEDPAERRRAAILAAQAKAPIPQETVAGLLWDARPAVRRAALAAAGRLDQPELWPRLIEQLRWNEFARAAAAALVAIGPPVLPALDLQFRRSGHEPATQLRILRILERIGGAEAARRLAAKLDEPRRAVQRQVLYALSALRHRAQGEAAAVLKQRVEEVVDRIAWLTAARLDVGQGERVARLAAALEREAGKETELLFLLLSLIADSGAIALMREHLAGENSEERAYVIEMAEVVIPADVKRVVLPVIEQLPPAPLLERLSVQFPQRTLSRGERLRDILQQGGGQIGPWTRACALEALPAVTAGPETGVPPELVANLFHPNPLVREMAARALREREPASYAGYLAKLPEPEASALAAVLPPVTARAAPEESPESRGILCFEKVLLLGETGIFGAIPPQVLARSADRFAEVRRQAGEAVFRAGERGRQLYVVASGEVEVQDGRRAVRRLGVREVLGEIAFAGSGVRSASVTAVTDSRLLRIEQTALLDLLGEHLAVLPEIVRSLAARTA